MSVLIRKKIVGLSSDKTEQFIENVIIKNNQEIENLKLEIINLENELKQMRTAKNDLKLGIKVDETIVNEIKNILFNMHLGNTKKVIKVTETENKKVSQYDDARKNIIESDYALRKKLIDLVVSTKTSIDL